MVYRGRPSTGCKTCRQRKIKCDERPEGCVKCAEKRLQCPGYESMIDRIFQDETAAVGRKVKKANAKALVAREQREQAEKIEKAERSEEARRAVSQVSNDVGLGLLTPLIDRGIAFFMMHYASGMDRPPVSSTYNQHLSTFGFHPIVATAMTALGLAGTANLFMDSGLKREATVWYSKALKLTNKALIEPSGSTSDHTLLATMLLSVYESTQNEFSFQGWLQHVQGSSTLVHMRGMSQFKTPAGRRMYTQTIGMLAMKCMGIGVALPRFVHEMNTEVKRYEDDRDPGNRFFHILIKVVDFRAQVLNHDLTDLHAIVDLALELDKEIMQMFEGVGSDWDYKVETCDEGTPGVFGTEYHIYPHLAAAQTWNWLRYTRIFVHDILRNALIAGISSSPPTFVGKRYTELLNESTEILFKAQSDIFASVPQYLHDTPNTPSTWTESTHLSLPSPTVIDNHPTPPGHDDTPSPYTSSPSPRQLPDVNLIRATECRTPKALITPPSTPKTFISNFQDPPKSTNPEFRIPATANEQLPIIRVSGGYSSLWALYIAASTPIASPESQAYVLRSFERVATEFGINQARVFAQALKTRIQLEQSGVSRMAEEELMRGEQSGWFETLGDRQKFMVRNAALKGGERQIAPIYMPRVGSHVN